MTHKPFTQCGLIGCTDHPGGPIETARNKLNSTPWWRPLKRQAAAREYRYALLDAALKERRFRP